MKLTTVLICAVLMQVSAATLAQKVTFVKQQATLDELFKAIRKQTGYNVLWSQNNLQGIQPQNYNYQNTDLSEVLDQALKGLPLTYQLEDHTVLIKQRTVPVIDRIKTALGVPITVSAKVRDESGRPLAGVTVKIKSTNTGTVTDKDGDFVITVPDNSTILTFSFIGFETQELAAKDIPTGSAIVMKTTLTNLKEVVVNKGYYSTTQELNTGDVASVRASDIEKQPVTNVLQALEGRVPGLLITQSSGIPGASSKVTLRGQSSIGSTLNFLPPDNPLFIIDGVPYAPNNNTVGQVSSALGLGGTSPLAAINIADIESIDVLKDADATAIYGSRGANGVILITTKKGRPGKTVFNLTAYSGVTHATTLDKMMNTDQYVALRREALANDGTTVDQFSAPDLAVFDTKRNTDFQKMFIGSYAHANDAQASISAGDANTQVLFSGGWHSEENVFTGNKKNETGSAHLNVNHTSSDQRFNLLLSATYSDANNHIPVSDLSNYAFLAPDFPALQDASGKPVFSYNGVSFDSPYGAILRPYLSSTTNLISSLNLSYKIVKGLTFRVNLGYNTYELKETLTYPIASQNTLFNPVGLVFSNDNYFKSWIVEPQLQYTADIWKGKLDVLAASSWQATNNENDGLATSGYISDAYLGDPSLAPTKNPSRSVALYHYQAVFGRIGYNIEDKYLINLTGRRDGSSRFGPGNQFGNFGAIGGAWIFSKEQWISRSLGPLSFGKLRASYGVTGNDQIGDYQYLNRFSPLSSSTTPYAGTPGVVPTALFNPDFQWEVNKKLEGGLDLGFLKDRIMFAASWFRNRSSNQLISYLLPAQTGFSSIAVKNFPAVVQNTGWEFSLNTTNIASKDFRWTTNATLTIPRNKLIAFPGLAQSSYASRLVIGQPVDIRHLYHYTGVDPQTGLFTVVDQNKDGVINSLDYVNAGSPSPKYYGGMNNTFSYKGFQLSVFIEGRNQTGYDYRYGLYASNPPGSIRNGFISNMPADLPAHWQKPGDHVQLQKLTAGFGTPASDAINNFVSSDGTVTDASYLRVKTVSLAYDFNRSVLTRLHLKGLQLYFHAENLFTITGYKFADPETQSLYVLPPMKVITAGMKLTL